MTNIATAAPSLPYDIDRHALNRLDPDHDGRFDRDDLAKMKPDAIRIAVLQGTTFDEASPLSLKASVHDSANLMASLPAEKIAGFLATQPFAGEPLHELEYTNALALSMPAEKFAQVLVALEKSAAAPAGKRGQAAGEILSGLIPAQQNAILAALDERAPKLARETRAHVAAPFDPHAAPDPLSPQQDWVKQQVEEMLRK